jgi:transposase
MDNLSSHQDPAIRGAIRKAGAKLFYLPKYSPDLNPIEQAFAKLNIARQRGRWPRVCIGISADHPPAAYHGD